MAQWWAFIVWVGSVGERQLEDFFFCFYVTPHKVIARELSYETGRG